MLTSAALLKSKVQNLIGIISSKYGERIEILYTFDKGFIPYASVSIVSAILNNKSRIRIHCLVEDPCSTALEPLRIFASSKKVEICFYKISESFSGRKITHHLKEAAYFRLLAPYVLDFDKVIYLDCDTLITCDLTKLWLTDLDESLLAGVIDMAGAASSKIPLQRGEPYINSGVLVMNLKGLRDNNLKGNVAEIFEHYSDELIWADQCLLNKFAVGRKQVISSRWNIQTTTCAPEDWRATLERHIGRSVIHTTGPIKPWMNSCQSWFCQIWQGYAKFLYKDVSQIMTD